MGGAALVRRHGAEIAADQLRDRGCRIGRHARLIPRQAAQSARPADADISDLMIARILVTYIPRNGQASCCGSELRPVRRRGSGDGRAARARRGAGGRGPRGARTVRRRLRTRLQPPAALARHARPAARRSRAPHRLGSRRGRGRRRPRRRASAATSSSSAIRGLPIDCNRDPGACRRDLRRCSEDTDDSRQRRSCRRKQRRVASTRLWAPFHAALERLLDQRRAARRPTALVTVHSFTPVYRGVSRPWHVGIISTDERSFADAMLAVAAAGQERSSSATTSPIRRRTTSTTPSAGTAATAACRTS